MAIALEFRSRILVIVLYNVQHKSVIMSHVMKTNVLSKQGLTVQMIINVLQDFVHPVRALAKILRSSSMVLELSLLVR
jgi:hypothetical protein